MTCDEGCTDALNEDSPGADRGALHSSKQLPIDLHAHLCADTELWLGHLNTRVTCLTAVKAAPST